MRIITVRQPWAWAIIHANKTIENRRTNIDGNYTGLVAIHAALNDDDSVLEPEHPMAGLILAPCPHNRDPRHNQYTCHWCSHVRPRRWLDQGTIIGITNLTSTHHATTCALGCSPWAEPDTWHLRLTQPLALTTPIRHRGLQGLTRLDPALARTLEQEWGNR